MVVHKLKFPEELNLLRKNGILIHNLGDIVASLSNRQNTILQSASGLELFDLVMLGREEK